METELTSRAMLTALSISTWTARRYDKKASKKTAEDNHVVDDAIRVNKKLFPFDCDVYTAIGNTASAARKTFYEETLPWLDNGSRILPAANFIEFNRKLKEKQNAFEDALPPFFEQYPFLKARSKVALNGLFREEDFPDKAKLKERFSFAVKFYPMPDKNDFRVDLSAQDVEAIKSQIELDTKSTINKAMEEPYRRLFDGVAHMAARLSGSKTCPCRNCKGKEYKGADFKDTLVNNLVDMCETLPRLNLTADPYLDSYIEQVKTGLTSFKPDIIRDSEQVKKTLAQRAAEIQSELAGWMGAA